MNISVETAARSDVSDISEQHSRLTGVQNDNIRLKGIVQDSNNLVYHLIFNKHTFSHFKQNKNKSKTNKKNKQNTCKLQWVCR